MIPIRGTPITRISNPEAGPADSESETQEKLGYNSLGKFSRHPDMRFATEGGTIGYLLFLETI